MPVSTFQPVVPAQIEELFDAVRRYYAEDGIPFDTAVIRPALVHLLNDPSLGRAFFLLNEVGSRLGYVVFTFGFDHEVGGKTAVVTDLFIEPTYRRRGLAKAALQFAVETCCEIGIRSLELQPEAHNAAGQALYRSFGFQSRDRVPMFLPLNGGA